jgi:signal transduction histidine kinase
MRQRIVVATVAVLAIALLAFAVPLAVAVRGLLVSRALDELQAATEQVAVFIDDQARTCGQVELILSVASQERRAALALFARDGRLLATVPNHRPTVGSEITVAQSGAAGRRHGAGSLAVAVPVSTTACGQRMILHAEEPDATMIAAVRRAWLGLAVVGGAVLGLAAAAGGYVARRLARPLDRLAASATRLGEGDFSVRVPPSGLPEVDAIAAALDATATRLGRAVERGRAFAADASHQLRTPLTALRLQLETLAAQGVAPDAVSAALAEADRLEATMLELVALTALETGEETIAPVELVREPATACRVLAAAAGRDVVLEDTGTGPVVVRPAAIRQSVQVLLDNALKHGQGTIRVTVAPTLPDQAVRGVMICVADEGSGPPDHVLATLRERDRGVASLPPTGGRGLQLARVLVEGEGGRLTFDAGPTGARACLVLPSR